MTEWIFQGIAGGRDLNDRGLDAATAESRVRSWRTPHYRDRTTKGERVWLQVAGPDRPGIYYVATIIVPTYEDPAWHDGDSPYARWRTDIRFDYRIEPPLLRVELLAVAALASFRPFRGFQGSTVPVPPDIAVALQERATPRLGAI